MCENGRTRRKATEGIFMIVNIQCTASCREVDTDVLSFSHCLLSSCLSSQRAAESQDPAEEDGSKGSEEGAQPAKRPAMSNFSFRPSPLFKATQGLILRQSSLTPPSTTGTSYTTHIQSTCIYLCILVYYSVHRCCVCAILYNCICPCMTMC